MMTLFKEFAVCGQTKGIFAIVIGLLFSIAMQGAELSLLVTGDMHGWMEPAIRNGVVVGGAAEMSAAWKKREGMFRDKFIVVACGDNLTGPAISSAYQGMPSILVMNKMGYDLSALGNHEMDFDGVKGFEKLRKNAKFPFIAANLANEDGTASKLTAPFEIVEKQGVKIGFVGLTVADFASVTTAAEVHALPYAESLRKIVPEIRNLGVSLIILVSHIPHADLINLAKECADLKIPIMLGGHSHELAQQKIGGTWVVSSGQWWQSYTRIDFESGAPDAGIHPFVISSKQVCLISKPENSVADPEVKAEIDLWKEKVVKDFGEIIGFSAKGISVRPGICDIVSQAWLEKYPADLVISNLWGFRQEIQPGQIRILDMIGVMPFVNSLLRIKMNGAQINSFNPGIEIPVYGGAKKLDGNLVKIADGKTFEPNKTYKVLMSSFFYGACPDFKNADPSPEIVNSDWRAPVIEWVKMRRSSPEKPLEAMSKSSSLQD